MHVAPDDRRKKLYITVLIIVGIVGLGTGLAWYNAGDVFAGLHSYGIAILAMCIGAILIMIDNNKVQTIGTMVFVGALMFMLIGSKV